MKKEVRIRKGGFIKVVMFIIGGEEGRGLGGGGEAHEAPAQNRHHGPDLPVEEGGAAAQVKRM